MVCKDFNSGAKFLFRTKSSRKHPTGVLRYVLRFKLKQYQCQIDQLVYKLYGLTEGEIRAVEESWID